MSHMTVSQVMTTDVVAVREDAPCHEIVTLLAEHRVSTVPVLDAGRRVVGVVSEADLLPKVEFSGQSGNQPLIRGSRRSSRQAKSLGSTARDLMTSPAVVVSGRATVVAAARLLDSHGIKRTPVVDDAGRLVGIVSRRDVLKVFLRADADITAEVVDDVLRRTLWIRPAEVSATVADGVVTLDGGVDDPTLIGIVVRLVRSVDGVTDVRDRLTHRVGTGAAGAPGHRPARRER